MQSPSSYGLQPWKFLEINDPTLRKQLRPELWNQSQITDCFYRVVFLVQRRSRSPNRKMAAVRGLDAAALVTYRQMIDVDLINGARSQQIERWASNQVYIALGTFMTAAALLEVDICTSNDLVNLSFECVINLACEGLLHPCRTH